MKKAVSIFLLIYYAFGNLLLPNGDFSTLPDLPKMYQHCKQTEDIDMTPLDFITDHLINIDCFFDDHADDDDQKPHQPYAAHQDTFQIQYCLIPLPTIVQCEQKIISQILKNTLPTFQKHAPKSMYLGSIFHPPILG